MEKKNSFGNTSPPESTILSRKNILMVTLIAIIFLTTTICLILIINRYGIDARGFGGTIEKIDGSSLFVFGSFIDDNHPEILRKTELVEIMITDKTKILKRSIFLPTRKELEISGGYYDGRKLKREESISDLNSLINYYQNGYVFLIVKSNKNIYGERKFFAEELIYEIGVESQ